MAGCRKGSEFMNRKPTDCAKVLHRFPLIYLIYDRVGTNFANGLNY